MLLGHVILKTGIHFGIELAIVKPNGLAGRKVIPKGLGLLPKGFQQGSGCYLSHGDVFQVAQSFIGTSDNPNRGGRILLCVAVASTGGLNNAVHPCREPDYLLEGDVHTGFNHLGGNTNNLLAGALRVFQRSLQFIERLSPMGNAHGSGEVKPFAIGVFQLLEQVGCCCFGVAHHQQTAAFLQNGLNQLGKLLQAGVSCVLNFGALERLPQCRVMRYNVRRYRIQRMTGVFPGGLGGGAKDNGCPTDLRKEIHGKVK